MTVTEYIASERIDRAKRLILTMDMSLGKVAEMCGFTDYYAFSHVFSRVEGVTASLYKRTKRNQGERK